MEPKGNKKLRFKLKDINTFSCSQAEHIPQHAIKEKSCGCSKLAGRLIFVCAVVAIEMATRSSYLCTNLRL